MKANDAYISHRGYAQGLDKHIYKNPSQKSHLQWTHGYDCEDHSRRRFPRHQ